MTEELTHPIMTDGHVRFETMVRENGPITLGDAKMYAGNLAADQQKHPCCRCYRVRCPTNSSCCPGSCVCLTCNLSLFDCIWYSCFFGVCYKGNGEYSCLDLKGNRYTLVKVDSGNERWGLFTENVIYDAQGDAREVSCYCG